METVTRSDNVIGSLEIGTTNYDSSYKFDLRPCQQDRVIITRLHETHMSCQNDVETNDQQCQFSSSTSFSANTVGNFCPPEVPNIFTKYINKRETTNNTSPTPTVQLRKYLEEILTMTVLPSNIFDFWKEKSEKYLALFKVANHALCVPALSAPVERIFSAGGLIMRPHRAKISYKMPEILVYLKCNFGFLEK